jgi:hypothetical protein
VLCRTTVDALENSKAVLVNSRDTALNRRSAAFDEWKAWQQKCYEGESEEDLYCAKAGALAKVCVTCSFGQRGLAEDLCPPPKTMELKRPKTKEPLKAGKQQYIIIRP